MRVGWSLVAGLALPLLAGCSTVALQGTRVETLPGSRASDHARSATLDVDGLAVSFHPADVVSAATPPPRLRLRLVFDPPALGYSFNPGEVRLEAPDGRAWTPHASVPGRFERGECRSPAAGTLAQGDSPYRFLTRGSCFDLVFDVTPARDDRMELVLAGLACGRRRLAPARLQVAHRRWRQIDRLYWLEALEIAGYLVLQAPMAPAQAP